MNRIEIWEPRYHDNVVLIAEHRVAPHNRLVFTKAKSLKDKVFYISGEDIKSCPLGSNGRINCYEVPMSMLEPVHG